jgi:hypothetical protein
MKRLLFTALLFGMAVCAALADQFYLVNSTDTWSFHEVYIAYRHSDDWGDNQLGPIEVLEPDESLQIHSDQPLSSVTVDILIIDEDGDTYTIYGKKVYKGKVEITSDDMY